MILLSRKKPANKRVARAPKRSTTNEKRTQRFYPWLEKRKQRHAEKAQNFTAKYHKFCTKTSAKVRTREARYDRNNVTDYQHQNGKTAGRGKGDKLCCGSCRKITEKSSAQTV
uniref:Uncharacterized protein n=1 Tax=uncultured marine virus TaxID=186617 RepID=A0A0F7L579_9VIRU|nr:hypothetical protein [uncultured marine virus]